MIGKATPQRCFPRSFRRDERGATMIEFAVAFPVFIFFFLGVMEIALITFGNAMIENMMNQTARLGIVGCQRNEFVDGSCDPKFMVDPVTLKKQITEKSFGLVDACDTNKFSFTVAPLGTPEAGDPNSNTVNLGQGDEVVVYYARYQWPVFSPFLTVRQIFGDFVDYHYATVMRNERFGYMKERLVQANGACE